MLSEYYVKIFPKVEGWVQPAAVAALGALDKISRESLVEGGACEIGVHHGRFFLALLACTPGRKALAIDLFDDQALNIDHSGSGSLTAFGQNIQRFAAEPQLTATLQIDSLGITAKVAAEIASEHGPFRLFSIDGGHTATHAFNDLLVAQDLIANGGVVILDDFFQPDWPGVTEALYRFYDTANAKILPVCLAGGKLFLVGASYHERYLNRLVVELRAERPNSFLKTTAIKGYKLINFRLHHQDRVV